jgi:hypothetical protein
MVLAGNVIFMNFIVAVVSEYNEKCMQSETVQQYRLRCDMIVERESIMTPEDFLKTRRNSPGTWSCVRRPKTSRWGLKNSGGDFRGAGGLY